MLQSIQFVGSGPPTYVYAQKAAGSSMEFYYVFAAETKKHDGDREKREQHVHLKKVALEDEHSEAEEARTMVDCKMESIQQVYEKEYGKRELFLWKQR